MDIASIKHKSLRAFAESGNAKGLDSQLVDRLRKMLAFLVAAESVDELKVPPNWGVHLLSGDRAGTWSLTVTRNWRLVFRIVDDSLVDLDLEDYH